MGGVPMKYYKICGGEPLYGSVEIQGSKNAALPMLAASLLSKGCIVLHNCPKILDVYSMLSILRSLGCRVQWEQSTVVIYTEGLFSCRVPEKYAGQMRSSVMLFGPLLGRVGCADIAYPGGCLIGARPVNLHQMALEAMGAVFENGENSIFAEAKSLKGAVITLPFPSVGATENIIMAAVLAEGVTCIENAAREPEVGALCSMLRSMGAKISGDSTAKIYIEGVTALHGTEITIPSDRIVMGTYASAVLGTGGEVFLEGDCSGQLTPFFAIARESGAVLRCTESGVQLHVRRPFHRPLHIVTEPYPGFPTDLQSPILALMAISGNTCSVEETIFEARFQICPELEKMGAVLQVEGQKAWVYGVENLHGAAVMAKDLRGGAALVTAGLFAQGETQVCGIEHIRRGYQHIEKDLQSLGGMVHIAEM